MKTTSFVTKATILAAGIVLLTGCGKYGNDPSSGGQLFLVGCAGNSDGSLTRGLYTMKVTAPQPKFEFITEYYAWANSLRYVDFNNGRIAYNVDNPPENQSCVAYMDASNLKAIKFVPTPAAEPGWICTVSKSVKPAVMKDGRIIYHVVFRRDVYEDHHEGQLAIFNPKTNSIELSGNPTDIVLAQPEQGGDTESGSMTGYFALSVDNKYVYCQVYGYGTDWGSYHTDYHFIVRYTIGQPFSYQRVAQTDLLVRGRTGDGKYLIVGSNGDSRINLANNLLEENVAESGTSSYIGEVAKNSSKVLATYRGEGLAIYDFNQTPSWMYYIIRQEDMESNYNGIGVSCLFSNDETKVYFTGSTDYYTNYRTDLTLFSCPVKEKNMEPDSLTQLPVEFCTNFMLLLSE